MTGPSCQRVACDHCGLPVPGAPEGEGPHFCCPGCRAVYGALHEAGLDDFYQYRQIDQTPREEPIGDELPEARADFDSESYQKQHTELLDDGTRQTELYLEGVHCAGCVWITEKMPTYVEGVVETRLDLARAVLTVRWDPDQVDLSEAVSWLTSFGYQPHPMRSEGRHERTSGERRLLVKVGVCWAIAANVMLLAFAMYAGLDAESDRAMWSAMRWLSLVLSALSVAYGGLEFFRRAALSLRDLVSTSGPGGLLKLSMDVPISLGILVGWGHSAWATVTASGEVWFDSISVLIAALLTARWLQARGRRAAGDAADRLLSLVPTSARRVDEDGEATVVAVDELSEGDIIEVRPSEVVPADGTLLSEETTTRRAVLTGESRPERLVRGDAVHAGETNLARPVRVRVDAVGQESRVGRLVAWVEERSRRRAPIVQLADRMGGVFVLATVVAAAVTGLIWWQIAPDEAVSRVVALLVVACPCALGMATPLALTVGSGQAARRGIYIKHDDVIEALADVDRVVFDKTGTLTRGEMAVVERVGSPEAIALASALEAHCHHPIGRAIAEEGAKKMRDGGVDTKKLRGCVDDVEEIVGRGIVGRVDGRRVEVGRPDWVERRAEQPGNVATASVVSRVAKDGHTPVAIAVDGKVEALVGIGDPLRDGCASFIDDLRERGIEAIILSGDHPQVVENVARRLEIGGEQAHGGVSPEQKAAFVARLAEEGTVAMVGDGVNDAAALQVADVGVAVGGGTEASLVAADVFMNRAGIEPVVELLEGGRRVIKVVHRNLGISAVYNVVAVGAAAAGLVGPLIAAVIMPVSSAVVVVSSLLQSSFGPNRAAQTREEDAFYESRGRDDGDLVPADSAGPTDRHRGRAGLLVGE